MHSCRGYLLVVRSGLGEGYRTRSANTDDVPSDRPVWPPHRDDMVSKGVSCHGGRDFGTREPFDRRHGCHRT
jgi:hypothetical protein